MRNSHFNNQTKEECVEWSDRENGMLTNTHPFNRIDKTHFEYESGEKTGLYTVVTLFGVLQQLFVAKRLVHVRIHGLRVTRRQDTHNTHSRCCNFLFWNNRNGVTVLWNRRSVHLNSVLLSPTHLATISASTTFSAVIHTLPFHPKSLKHGRIAHINRGRR